MLSSTVIALLSKFKTSRNMIRSLSLIERKYNNDKACFILAGIDEKSLLEAVDTVVQMNLEEHFLINVLRTIRL